MPRRACVARSFSPSLIAAQTNRPRTRTAVSETTRAIMIAAAMLMCARVPGGTDRHARAIGTCWARFRVEQVCAREPCLGGCSWVWASVRSAGLPPRLLLCSRPPSGGRDPGTRLAHRSPHGSAVARAASAGSRARPCSCSRRRADARAERVGAWAARLGKPAEQGLRARTTRGLRTDSGRSRGTRLALAVNGRRPVRVRDGPRLSQLRRKTTGVIVGMVANG
jgi:hypothetical protein